MNIAALLNVLPNNTNGVNNTLKEGSVSNSKTNKGEETFSNILNKDNLKKKTVTQTKNETNKDEKTKVADIKEEGAQKAKVKETNTKETETKGNSVKETNAKKTDTKDTSVKETNAKETDTKDNNVKKTNVKEIDIKKDEIQKVDNSAGSIEELNVKDDFEIKGNLKNGEDIILSDKELFLKNSSDFKIDINNKTEHLSKVDFENLELNAKELVELLQNIAEKFLDKQEAEKITIPESEKLVEKTKDLLEILKELQNVLSQGEQPNHLLKNINKLITSVSEFKNNIGGIEDFKSLKEIGTVLSDIKNETWEIGKDIMDNEELKPVFTKFLSKINELEDAIVNITKDKTSNIKLEVINIMKSESPSNEKTEKQNEIDGNSTFNGVEVEKNTPTNSVENSVAINSVEQNAINKNIKTEKPIELNLEQLKQKVHDKFEQIQKMIVAKDKMFVQLNPKNLGNVEMLFKKTSEGIELTIETEGKGTKHKIEMLFDDMKKDFKERNIELNFVFKEKQKEEKEENSERKNEYKQEERNVENENEPEQVFEEIMERVLRGE
ncbi:flagellar hook-length control protein FliK [Bacillus thuringiensis]|uniref:flagellar hook-length control protein FliK n=1 Tax=Bacillus thuringiensis TaxID=1428 RepID=UPI0021D679BA|nr:flagellar hook-length control protein FliK [Bacillus thuringiensis]MCU7667015.1 hypothetical protein [Bacillus thuringiensis]